MTQHIYKLEIALAITLATHAVLAIAQVVPTTVSERMEPNMEKPYLSISIDSLEIVGVGISVETWRNHPSYPKFNLWTAVEQSNGNYIISQEAKHYAKNFSDLDMLSAKRKEDAVDIAMRDFMDRYPLPVAIVGPAWRGPNNERELHLEREANAGSFVETFDGTAYTSRGSFAGLLTQSGQVMNSYLMDEADLLWRTLFATFTQNGDIPALAVAAKDGVVQRAAAYYDTDRSKFNALAESAYRPKQPATMSDSWTFLTLIRRGRIEQLRAYAPLVIDTMTVKNRNENYSRNWSEFAGWKKQPPTPFTPTTYIPTPWTSFQIDQFDHLENLGTLHRPNVVSYVDAEGKPIKASERVQRMTEALRAALLPIGGKLPARILYDYGSVWEDRTSATRFVPLVQSLQEIEPDFDILAPKKGYDLSRILGDTGAGSPFVAVALASMAGRQSAGATLIANLRRNDGATLLLVTPPSAEQMKKDAQVKRPFFPSTVGIKNQM